jgi:uncharacterized protein YecA (UPF0149 family)
MQKGTDMRTDQMVTAAIIAATSIDGVTAPVFTPNNRQRNNRTPYVGRLAGRNEPCPCGSGKKYKRCCMRTEAVRFEQRKEANETR